MSDKPLQHGGGQSDERVVPMKDPNKGGQPLAEGLEGSRSAKENSATPDTDRTQSRAPVSQGLSGVRQAARRDGKMRFTALLHHVTERLLLDSYYALNRQAATGVDRVTWQEYGQGVEERIQDLHGRIHRGGYRAQPSLRIYIPKADGRKRPIGIAALEDKVVQQAVRMVLEAIWEEEFLSFSYGFRPGRGAHDALDALEVALTRKKVNFVLDMDIRGFFDNLDHEWMMKFVEHRVADPRMQRLIRKWLKAGVSEDGNWSETKVGTPQGAVISPLLANIYLHYVLDQWVQSWRKKKARGDVIIVRYADDAVMGFQYREEAERLLEELQGRMRKFGLELHPEKTRLIEFGRYAAERREKHGEGKPETFDFLGFTHICGKNRKTKQFTVRRKTVAKRLTTKLKDIKQKLTRRMQQGTDRTGDWLQSVVQGYLNYHAIPGNYPALHLFRREVIRHWWMALRRRSQRSRYRWEKFERLVERWIPKAKILHPYPHVRFDVKHPRQEPCAVMPLARICAGGAQ